MEILNISDYQMNKKYFSIFLSPFKDNYKISLVNILLNFSYVIAVVFEIELFRRLILAIEI